MGIVAHISKRWETTARRKTWLLYVLLVCLLFLCMAASLFSVLDYQVYGTQVLRAVAEEHEGIAYMKKAQALLGQLAEHAADIELVDQAGKAFELARNSFTRLDSDLRDFPVISVHIPMLNTRLRAGKHLVPLSIWMARVGIEICDGVKTLMVRFHDPLKIQEGGITQSDLDFISSKVHKVRLFVEAALAEARQLGPADVSYDARTAALFDSFQKVVPGLYAWLSDIELVMPVLPALLGVGSPTNYLLEMLDPAELRPGGGVIGNYGFATFSAGKMTGMRIIDVDLLDHSFASSGKYLPYPAAYQWFSHALSSRSWNVRDANLDADFPTSARYTELNYIREGGNVPVQGVIAITPALIQRLLSLSDASQFTASYVPAASLAMSLAYQPLLMPLAQAAITMSKGQLSGQAVTRWLASVSLSQLLQVLYTSLHSKDLQIYFNSTIAEDMLQHHQLASAVGPLTGDGMLVVDTNIGNNRANSSILNALSDRVVLDENGNATHTTILNYSWSPAETILGSLSYHGYIQLYLPPGSSIQSQSGWSERGVLATSGRKTVLGEFALDGAAQTHAITIQWMEPGAAKKDASGWHYHFLLQRQAGTQWQVDLHIHLPSCVIAARGTGGLSYDSMRGATLSQSLDQDLTPGIDYNC